MRIAIIIALAGCAAAFAPASRQSQSTSAIAAKNKVSSSSFAGEPITQMPLRSYGSIEVSDYAIQEQLDLLRATETDDDIRVPEYEGGIYKEPGAGKEGNDKNLFDSKSSHPMPNKSSMLQLRRLNTAIDKFSVHKLSTAAFCVSTAVMTVSGLSYHLQEVPDSLELWTWLFFISSHVMGVTSIEMSLKYRRNDETAKVGFINTALIAVAFSWATMYMAPFAPDAFNTYLFGNGIAFITNVPAIFVSLQQLFKLPSVFNSKQFERSQDVTTKVVIALVVGVGLYASMRAGHIMLDPSHDRNWVMESTENLELPHGKHFMAYNYYAGVLGAQAVSYGSLGITLFHKKIVSSEVQQLMVGLPALLYFIFQLYAWGNFW